MPPRINVKTDNDQPKELVQNGLTGRTVGKDGKSYPKTKPRGKAKLTVVDDLPDDDEPLDVDEVEDEEPQDNSLHNARERDKRPNPFMCDIDTWEDTYKLFNRMVDDGIGALLRNPTYLETERVEALLRKALVRTSKIKAGIEAAHTERQAAQ